MLTQKLMNRAGTPALPRNSALVVNRQRAK